MTTESQRVEKRAVYERFLLGLLSDEGRRKVEEEIFADDAAYAELLETEHDLMDALVKGEDLGLEPATTETLRHSPSSKSELAFARAFMRVTHQEYISADQQNSGWAESSKRESRPLLRWLAAAFLAAAIGAWLVVGPASKTETYVVASGAIRGTEAPQLVLGDDVDRVELLLEVTEAIESELYATVSGSAGMVAERVKLERRTLEWGTVAVLVVAAEDLSSGALHIAIESENRSGSGEIAEFSIEVVRR